LLLLAYLLIISRGGYSLANYRLLVKSYNYISNKGATYLKPPLRIYPYTPHITDLILAVVELLERDISRLVVEVREVLELVELWDKG
jgi:hypothetical protein